MRKITTQKDYGIVKNQVEVIIKEATQKGKTESDKDNAYTRKIVELNKKRVCNTSVRLKNEGYQKGLLE